MAKKLEIYKCEICGNIIEVLHGGKGQLVCCGEPMNLLEEQTADQTKEKHVPVIEVTEKGTRVVVGSTLHPMTEKHWIEWIQVIIDGKTYRQFLNPEDAPEAIFKVKGDKVIAREFCNIHGLWKAEK
ncbi:MAG: desulfoferrodoxin [Candidatus Heimdallarchaeota archaeon]|nr:desulfoferrodoxin [Candidatus Heimdallarchaeota archaeon]